MKLRRVFLLSALSLFSKGVFFNSLYAQNIDLSHGGQITVTALGGFDWDQNLKTVTAYDNAKAVRNNVTVTADRLVAHYRKKTNTGAASSQPGATDTNATGQVPAPNGDKNKEGGQDDTGANEIYRLYAYGHVHIYTDTDQAWGDKAVYDMDQAILVLTGKKMKLTTPQNIMTARDAMEYHSNTRMSVGRGDATATNIKDGNQIKADVLVGYSSPSNSNQPNNAQNPKNNNSDSATQSSKLDKVNAFGNVVVRTQNETIRGDRGVYVPSTGISRIVGNVHITRGQNQLHGYAAIINMHTGIAHMTEMPGRRVQGLVVPNETGQGNQPSKH